MSAFAQIIILLIVLASMVMVLLAIRQLTHFERFDDSEETLHLKHEVDDEGKVLTRNNIFSTLVDAEPNPEEDIYKGNSKDPFSRKE